MVNRGSPFRLIVPSWIARSFRFNACLNYRANRTAGFVSESPPFRNTRKNGRIFDTDLDIQPEEKVSSETVVAPRNRASSPIVRESTLLRHVVLSFPLLSSPRELFIRGLEITATSNLLSVRREEGGGERRFDSVH